MANNPIPTRITDPMWRFWEEADDIIPGVLLGGIYAVKSGYHGTREYNQQNYPNNYSIKLPLDLQGPSDKAAAIDLTMSDTEMRKRTGYLKAAVGRQDPRLYALREFYGTLDSKTVFGRIKDSYSGTWRWSTSDSSHLWHIHLSFFRSFVNTWEEISKVLSVLKGESLTQYQERTGDLIGTQEGDSGQVVNGVQALLRYTGRKLDPDALKPNQENGVLISVDGRWGPRTSLYLFVARRYIGSKVTNNQTVLTGWGFAQLILAVFKYQATVLFEKLLDSKKEQLKSEIVAAIPVTEPTHEAIQAAIHDYVIDEPTFKEILKEQITLYIENNKSDFIGPQGPAGPVADEVTIRVKTGDIS